MLLARTIETPLGPMIAGVLSAARESLCLLEFATRAELADERAELARAFECEWREEAAALHGVVADQLGAYFAGERRDFDVALTTPGTPFQQSVWSALQQIPYGETITYATLAERVGRPKGFRAVGGANGRNRVAIVVPCHRVVAAKGLGGYAGGLDRKRALLALENPHAWGSLAAASLASRA